MRLIKWPPDRPFHNFGILELQNPLHDSPELHKIRRLSLTYLWGLTWGLWSSTQRGDSFQGAVSLSTDSKLTGTPFVDDLPEDHKYFRRKNTDTNPRKMIHLLLVAYFIFLFNCLLSLSPTQLVNVFTEQNYFMINNKKLFSCPYCGFHLDAPLLFLLLLPCR